MKKTNLTYVIALGLSILFVVVQLWNGLTRPLGGYYYSDETRNDAIVSSIVFSVLIGLLLFGLLYALSKKKLFAEILWVLIAPALFMLSWDTITKNLVENGRLATSWLTDSAYLQEPSASTHRAIWIVCGILVSLPFLLAIYNRFMSRKT